MDRINVGDLVLYHDQKAICTHKSNTVCHFRMMDSTGYAPVVLDSFFVGLYFDKGDLKIISKATCETVRKNNSFLESGYVYAPYVPQLTTPTIFGTKDFVKRKDRAK